MRAGVVNRKELTVDVDDGDSFAANSHLLHFTGLDLGRPCHGLKITHSGWYPFNAARCKMIVISTTDRFIPLRYGRDDNCYEKLL